jgi:hypothetical protein
MTDVLGCSDEHHHLAPPRTCPTCGQSTAPVHEDEDPIEFIPVDDVGDHTPGCRECGNDLGPYNGLCLDCLQQTEHRYISTACQHERCAACRISCKYCEALCICHCHQNAAQQ